MQGMDTGTKPRSFSDLPPEILSSIADRLSIIELLSFRGTCNDFRSASSTASAAVQSNRTPWLLLDKADTSDCLFYNDEESKTYNRNIPDLQGAICLASYNGWLLLFKDESMFFFCPFSLAKIKLPDFPLKQIDGHVAAFSDVPTSRNCIVSVIKRVSKIKVVVYVISKGQSSWAPHEITPAVTSAASITGAAFDRRDHTFYYMENVKSFHAYSVKPFKWITYTIVPVGEGKGLDPNHPLYYRYWKDVFRMGIAEVKEKRERLKLEDDECVAVCGLSSYGSTSEPHVYLNEVVNHSTEKKRVSRAVWIHPRFFQVDSNQRWETK